MLSEENKKILISLLEKAHPETVGPMSDETDEYLKQAILSANPRCLELGLLYCLSRIDDETYVYLTGNKASTRTYRMNACISDLMFEKDAELKLRSHVEDLIDIEAGREALRDPANFSEEEIDEYNKKRKAGFINEIYSLISERFENYNVEPVLTALSAMKLLPNEPSIDPGLSSSYQTPDRVEKRSGTLVPISDSHFSDEKIIDLVKRYYSSPRNQELYDGLKVEIRRIYDKLFTMAHIEGKLIDVDEIKPENVYSYLYAILQTTVFSRKLPEQEKYRAKAVGIAEKILSKLRKLTDNTIINNDEYHINLYNVHRRMLQSWCGEISPVKSGAVKFSMLEIPHENITVYWREIYKSMPEGRSSETLKNIALITEKRRHFEAMLANVLGKILSKNVSVQLSIEELRIAKDAVYNSENKEAPFSNAMRLLEITDTTKSLQDLEKKLQQQVITSLLNCKTDDAFSNIFKEIIRSPFEGFSKTYWNSLCETSKESSEKLSEKEMEFIFKNFDSQYNDSEDEKNRSIQLFLKALKQKSNGSLVSFYSPAPVYESIKSPFAFALYCLYLSKQNKKSFKSEEIDFIKSKAKGLVDLDKVAIASPFESSGDQIEDLGQASRKAVLELIGDQWLISLRKIKSTDVTEIDRQISLHPCDKKGAFISLLDGSNTAGEIIAIISNFKAQRITMSSATSLGLKR